MIQHVRLSDQAAISLRRQAKAVNVVWNYCNRVQIKACLEGRRGWLSAYDLMKLTAGASELLGLHSHTISGVCKHYAEERQRRTAPWLPGRGRQDETWIPFNTGHVAFDGKHIVFRGERFTIADGLAGLVSGEKFRSGIFYATPDGHWYVQLRREAERPAAVAGAPTSTRCALEQGRRRRAVQDPATVPLPPMQHQAPRPRPIVSG